jgi:hypothetical protein
MTKGPIGLTRRSYNSARERCNDPSSPHYAMFGGAGIKFLLPPFEEFVAILGTKPAQSRLSRIDPAKDYEIGNVEWKFDPKIPVRVPRPAWIGPHTQKTTERIHRQLVRSHLGEGRKLEEIQHQLEVRARLFILSNLKGRVLARVIGDAALAEGIDAATLRRALHVLGVEYVTSTGGKWTKGSHEFCFWELPGAGPDPRAAESDPASTDAGEGKPVGVDGAGNQTAVTATPEELAKRRLRLAKRFSPIRMLPVAANKGETR